MFKFIASVGLSPFLMTIHYVPLLTAAIIWSFVEAELSTRSAIADLVGIFGLLVAFLLYFVFSDGRTGAEGGAAQWFVIYSILSIGSLPIVTIGLHFLAGRQIGRCIRHFRV